MTSWRLFGRHFSSQRVKSSQHFSSEMSDEDRDVDIESDEDDEDGLSLSQSATHFMTPAERRAHHNALERKRRDHIKESFTSLRDSVPNLHGEKVKVSRAQILKKAAEYITFMRRKNHSHQQDIDDLKRHNNILEQQIKSLEKAKNTGQFAVSGSLNARSGTLGRFDELESDSEENIATVPKKLKLAS